MTSIEKLAAAKCPDCVDGIAPGGGDAVYQCDTCHGTGVMVPAADERTGRNSLGVGGQDENRTRQAGMEHGQYLTTNHEASRRKGNAR